MKMADKVPVPAEALRQVASSATEEVSAARERGHKATARQTEQAISEAYAALDGRDGEYVSIDATCLSTLTSASDINEVPGYEDCCKTYLQQYNVW